MSLPDLASLHWEATPVDQAASLRRSFVAGAPLDKVTAVVSGKGGVGKSNVVANLAVAAAGLGARVLVVDGDMGLSNLDVLMGLCPEKTIIDVLTGRCALAQALVDGPKGIKLLPAGSGRYDLAAFEAGGTARVIALLEASAADYDLILLDAGAGIGKVVVELAAAASQVLLVVVPEPTSFADAYATCKTLWIANPELKIEALVNCSENQREGRQVHSHLEKMCDRFLNKSLGLRGILPWDRRLRDAVTQQRVVVEQFPNSSIAKCFVELAQQMIRQQCRAAPGPHADRDAIFPSEKEEENQNEKGGAKGDF